MSTAKWREEHQEEMKAYRRKHYHANKGPYIARALEQRKERKRWWKAYKKTLQCTRCPENHPACLDFHHKDPSKKSITLGNKAVTCGWSLKRLMSEVEKCEVLCANCHRKEHFPK